MNRYLSYDEAGSLTGMGFDPETMANYILAPDWFDPARHFTTGKIENGLLTTDLNPLKKDRKTAIKAEAAALIAATDWRLERARERETAGWAGLADVDAVLAEREAIRQSSSAAELAVDALTDATAIQSFSWAVDVPVKPPRRLTLRLFMERFTEPEQAAILAAAETTPAVKTWWTRFQISLGINLDDPATTTGVEALEALKLIGKGRAKQILG